MPLQSSECVVIAKVGKTHGIKGALRLHTFTEDAHAILTFKDYFLRFPGKPWLPLSDISIKPHGDGFVIFFPDAPDCNLAQRYVNAELAVSRDALPELQQGEGYYWIDLLGLTVKNTRGDVFGKVSELLETGANEVMVVQGDREYLIPCVASIILSVEKGQGVVTVEWEKDWL